MSRQLIEDSERQQFIDASIKQVQKLSAKIAKLKAEKEEVEKEIIGAFDHKKEGQTTYEFIDKQIVIKTGFNYSLDKKAYEVIKEYIPVDLNPVSIKPIYYIDKGKIKEIKEERPQDFESLLKQFIRISDSKPSVSIKDRT